MTRSKGQGQGQEPFKVGNSAIYKSCLLCHLQWELATDHGFLNYGTISNFNRAGFLIFVLVFVLHDFELAETSVMKSRLSVPYGDNLSAGWQRMAVSK